MTCPYDETMDFTCRHVEPGKATYTATAGPQHHNPTGRLHGGYLSSLADTAMGAAYMAALDGAQGTNLDLSMRFLRPIFEGPLRAEASTTRAGRTVSLLSCQIFDVDDRLVATAQSQFLRLPMPE